VESQLKIWQASIPSEWAPPPEFMNIHYLLDAERCPRSVALKNSTYAELWKGKGYPDRPNQFVLLGRIVHSTIQEVIGKLIEANCYSIRDPGAVAQLKKIGGYSAVITSKTEAVLRSLENNPRTLRGKGQLGVELRSKMPHIREQVQIMLSRLSWVPRRNRSVIAEGAQDRHRKEMKRTPLSEGAYCEIDLIDRGSMWKGFADLIEIREGGCAITDFKSGRRSDAHETQLLVYAWLWQNDTERNPGQIPVKRLVLSYVEGEVELPTPSADKLSSVIQDLRIRTIAVREAMAGTLPEAKVDLKLCRDCSVRLLCDEYWALARNVSAKGDNISTSDDVEVTLLDRQTNRAWEAACCVSSCVPVKKRRVLIRFNASDFELEAEMSAGKTVRFTEAYVVTGGEGEMPVVQVTSRTEPLVVIRSEIHEHSQTKRGQV
jgi:hypothetical protein